MPKIIYQPEGFHIGDAMPYYEDGTLYLYHYKSKIGSHDEDQNWTLSQTTDFIHYEDCGELFLCGGKGECDHVLRSGTLMRDREGIYRFFYGGDFGKECILQATGDNVYNLKKDPDFYIGAQDGYCLQEWRDPCVFWDEESQNYIMTVGTRKLNGERYLNGATVWFTSKDLQSFAFKGDLWAPSEYTTHEMPNLFKLGGWWYHAVSEYSENTQVIYRMSRNINGPWIRPKDDGIDGAAYFAGKIFFTEEDCLMAGWIASRDGDTDRGLLNGSGGLFTHRLIQNTDGTLNTALPDSVFEYFKKKEEIISAYTFGDAYGQKSVFLHEIDAVTYLIEATIEVVDQETSSFSVLLAGDEQTGQAYEYRFHFHENRLTFCDTPNHGITPPDHFRGMERLARPIELENNQLRLTILCDESYCVAYANGKALSARMYTSFGKRVGISVGYGEVKVSMSILTV